MLFFLNYPRNLVESAFYITKKGGGESFCKPRKQDMTQKRGKTP